MLTLIFRDNINLTVNVASGNYTSEYSAFLSVVLVVSTEPLSPYNLHLDHSPTVTGDYSLIDPTWLDMYFLNLLIVDIQMQIVKVLNLETPLILP